MAGKRRAVPKPEKDDVRIAIRHFAELSAAFEGWGIELGGGQEEDDLRTLHDVVQALLEHRRRQRQRQADPFRARLVEQLVGAYTSAKVNRLTKEQVGAVIKETVGVASFSPDEGEIRKIAIPASHALETDAHRSIRSLGGRRQAARDKLGPLVGRCSRDLHDIVRRKDDLPVTRVTFSRYVPEFLAVNYLRDAFGAVDAQLSRAGESLAALRAIDEGTGRSLDRLSDALFRDFFLTRKGYCRLLVEDVASGSAALARIRSGFWKDWVSACASLDQFTMPTERRQFEAVVGKNVQLPTGVTASDAAEAWIFCTRGAALLSARVAHNRQDLGLDPEEAMQSPEAASCVSTLETLALRMYQTESCGPLTSGVLQWLRVQTLPHSAAGAIHAAAGRRE